MNNKTISIIIVLLILNGSNIFTTTSISQTNPIIESSPDYVFEGGVFTLELSNLEINNTYSIFVENVFKIKFVAEVDPAFIQLLVMDLNDDSLLYVTLFDENNKNLAELYINIREVGGFPLITWETIGFVISIFLLGALLLTFLTFIFTKNS